MKKYIIVGLVLSVGLLSFIKGKETTYSVDTKNSTAVWTGKKVTGEHKGIVPLSSGQVSIANSQITSGTFEFNLDALTVTDITDSESNAKLVTHLKGEDFFSTAKFPTAKFVITGVHHKEGDRYDVNGNLTIKGITNAIGFPASINANDKKFIATGQITVNRTKFDIKYKSASFVESIGDKAISDDFTLDVVIFANAK
jgi:polyisoprenoid-binding protein YceI